MGCSPVGIVYCLEVSKGEQRAVYGRVRLDIGPSSELARIAVCDDARLARDNVRARRPGGEKCSTIAVLIKIKKRMLVGYAEESFPCCR